MKHLLLILAISMVACSHIDPESPNGGGESVWVKQAYERIEEIEYHLINIESSLYDCEDSTLLALKWELTKEHEVLIKKLKDNGYEI